ncbi:MAG: hypothetical protein RML95_12450 [Anaerolineae bacterium]|nr:hypothetical protein [Anaerolineae bacterium]
MDIKSLAKAIRSAQRGKLDAEFDSLCYLSAHSTSIERANAFLDTLSSLVEEKFLGQQVTSQLPRVSELANIRNATEKLMWGVLYWHYFHPARLRMRSIAKLSGIPLKKLQSSCLDGLRALLDYLQKIEQQERRQRVRNQYLASAARRLTDRLTNAQQRLAHRVEGHLSSGRLLVIVGTLGGGESDVAMHFNRLIESSAHESLWIDAQRTWLDRYGILRFLPDAPQSAEAITKQMYDGLGFSGHSAPDEWIRAIASYPADIVFIINRVDALPPQQWQALQTYMERLYHHHFVLTTRHRFQHPYASFFHVPELDVAQSGDLLENARRSESAHKLPPLDKADFEKLYQLVGGLPLALTVLGTRLAHISVAQAVADLKCAEPPFNALYKYVLCDAWRQLSEDGHELLLYMVSQQHCWLSARHLATYDLGRRVWEAIEEVDRHCIIERMVEGDCHYVRLKPLVRTALSSAIYLGW